MLSKILNKFYTFYIGLYPSIAIAKGSIIDRRCEIVDKSHVTLGARTSLYKHVTIYKKNEGSVVVGSYSHLGSYTYILVEDRKLIIGNYVAIGPFCSFFCVSNGYEKGKKFVQSHKKGDIFIGNNVFIGAHCIILPGTYIEDNVMVAANSTISGRLKSGYLYGGNPARAIKELE